MPHEISTDNGLLTARFHGQITSSELMGIPDEAAAIEAQGAEAMDRLIDMSEAVGIDLNFADLELLARRRSSARLRNKVRSALYAPRPIQFGFARMFQTLVSNPNLEVEVFSDLPSAQRWLRDKPVGLPKVV